MTLFVAERLKLDPVEARRLQKAYYHSHGTTLCGLMEVHGIEPLEFLDFVHEIDLSPISADAALAAGLARLPGRRLVHTNGSRSHAQRVLERLGIAGFFDAIHDIAASAFSPKPRRDAYDRLIAAHGVDPRSAAMFEDITRNLEVPHALGMTTILITGEKPWERAGEAVPEPPIHVHHVTDDLAGFLAKARVMSYEPSVAGGKEPP